MHISTLCCILRSILTWIIDIFVCLSADWGRILAMMSSHLVMWVNTCQCHINHLSNKPTSVHKTSVTSPCSVSIDDDIWSDTVVTVHNRKAPLNTSLVALMIISHLIHHSGKIFPFLCLKLVLFPWKIYRKWITQFCGNGASETYSQGKVSEI